MNIKRFIGNALFGALLVSAIQTPIQASWATWFVKTFVLGGISVDKEVEAKGQEFGNWWSQTATDSDKLMATGACAVAIWFGLNHFFNKDNSKKPSSVFSLFFGLFGALGLKNWVDTKMDEGSKEVRENVGVNMQEPVEREDRIFNAVKLLYGELGGSQNPSQPAAPVPAQQSVPAQAPAQPISAHAPVAQQPQQEGSPLKNMWSAAANLDLFGVMRAFLTTPVAQAPQAPVNNVQQPVVVPVIQQPSNLPAIAHVD